MSSVSQPQGSDEDPRPPNDRELREAVTLATIAAIVALLLSHDPALAVAVFTAVAGALRPPP